MKFCLNKTRKVTKKEKTIESDSSVSQKQQCTLDSSAVNGLKEVKIVLNLLGAMSSLFNIKPFAVLHRQKSWETLN